MTQAPGWAPYPIVVGTLVAMSSSIGHTGALTMALTSLLLPCLNSPMTMTRTLGSTSRSWVWSSRCTRSLRPIELAARATVSISSANWLFACSSTAATVGGRSATCPEEPRFSGVRLLLVDPVTDTPSSDFRDSPRYGIAGRRPTSGDPPSAAWPRTSSTPDQPCGWSGVDGWGTGLTYRSGPCRSRRRGWRSGRSTGRCSSRTGPGSWRRPPP